MSTDETPVSPEQYARNLEIAEQIAAELAATHVFHASGEETNDGVDLRARDQARVRVTRWITEPEDRYDAEVLPMAEIRFADGVEISAFDDELTPIAGAGEDAR